MLALFYFKLALGSRSCFTEWAAQLCAVRVLVGSPVHTICWAHLSHLVHLLMLALVLPQVVALCLSADCPTFHTGLVLSPFLMSREE